MTLPLHLHQRESHDCGVASVAMAASVDYADAKTAFQALDLHQKKRGRQPYSSNFKNVKDALDLLGCETSMRRFTSWDHIQGPTIVKVDIGHPRNWHWVYATRDKVLGLVVLDPGLPLPYLERPPLDVPFVALEHFKPRGCMIAVRHSKAKVQPPAPPARMAMILARLAQHKRAAYEDETDCNGHAFMPTSRDPGCAAVGVCSAQ